MIQQPTNASRTSYEEVRPRHDAQGWWLRLVALRSMYERVTYPVAARRVPSVAEGVRMRMATRMGVFAVSEEQLRLAVKEVGSDSGDVKAYFEKNEGLRESHS